MVGTDEVGPIAGKIALVTGASYGAGAAIAQALAEAGADVIVTATRIENLSATLAALQQTGRRSTALQLDLGKQESIDAVIAAATQTYGGVDILVNNAARPMRKSAIDVSRAAWDAVIDINISGTFFMTTAFARSAIASGRSGCVISIASTHGLLGAAERSVYGISKGAIIQMTRMLAIEWADKGFRVNAIAPGRLDTPSPSRSATAADSVYMEAMLNRIPLRRMTTAQDVAAAAVYLASPGAAAMTGQILVLDGGLSVA